MALSPVRVMSARCGRHTGRSPAGYLRRSAIDAHVGFQQVPAPRSHEEGSRLLGKAVGPPVRVCECDRSADRVDEVYVARDEILPRRELASSKSAMNVLAPELRALITIFRSTGPVISTRRSRRSCGRGATLQDPSRIVRASGRKSGRRPASNVA